MSGLDSKVSSLLHFDIDFTDAVGENIWEATGDAIVSNIQNKFGGKSLYLNKSSYLKTSFSEKFNVSTGDFTIDWWEYPVSGAAYPVVFSIDSPTNEAGLVVGESVSGTRNCYISSTATSGWDICAGFSLGGVTNNEWSHFALVRKGDTFYGFKNGILTSTVKSSSAIYLKETFSPIIGKRTNNGYDYWFLGYIDEFRFSKGIARWTSNFTPPTRAYSFGGALFKKDSTFYDLNPDKTLNNLGTPATRDDMIVLFKNNAIPQSIDSATANAIKENNLKLAVWDADVDSNCDTIVKATPAKTQFVQEANDISLKEASYIDWIKINDTIVESTGSGAIRHLVSRDSGKTWYAYDSVEAAWNLIIDTTNAADGSFDTTDTKRFVPSDAALTKIMNNGMTSTAVAAAPFQAWTIDGGYKQIRFAHTLQISSTVDTAFMDNIKYQYDGTGTWDLGANKVDYKVSTNNNTHKLTWITGGKRVKVNY